MTKTDIVIPWVDPLDPEWIKQKEHYQKESGDADFRPSRYRDWDQLKYVFRSIEKNCPWVDKVFFITSGQLPSWMNPDCEKLIWIRHEDYIPEEYLPTFSSHPIELNLYRIDELSDRFIYFNDDMFVISPMEESLFFRNGLPVYPAILHANTSRDQSEVMPYVYLNNKLAVNRHFSKKDVLAKKEKWFSLKENGLRSVVENLFNSRYPEIIGFYHSHLPTPFLKQTLKEVWEAEEELLDRTCRNRFRSREDVSQYLFRCWDLAKGEFYPIDPKKLGKETDIRSNTVDTICSMIENRKVKMLCLNDSDEIADEKEFEMLKDRINRSFEKIFPEKSQFER